ncbi:unnamed protein product [Calypogeia fissa]
MELLKGPHAACNSCRWVELLFIGLVMLRFSQAQAVIFHYGYSGNKFNFKPLYVPGNPSANIIELQNGSTTCLGDFYDDGYGAIGLQSNVALRTPQGVDLSGRCLYNRPVQLRQTNGVNSFGTMFKFQMIDAYQYTEAYCGPSSNSTLEGLAFIISTDTSTQGAAKGYLGWLNSTTNAKPGQNSTGHNFAVEIDFFQDVEFQDPLGTHVGVDSNSMTSKATAIILGSLVDYASNSVTVWIEYDGSAQKLEVFTNVSSDFTSAKPMTPILSTAIDLSELLSQDSMFVGFSGSVSNFTTFSGALDREYDVGYQITEWTFNSDGLAPDWPRNLDGTEQISDSAEVQKRRTERIIIVVATIPSALLFLLLVFIIYKLYRRNTRLAAIAKKYQIEEDLLEQGPQKFRHMVLSAATKGFSSRELLGKGGFGSVYRGKLRMKGGQKPEDVAVKRISAASHQGAREFLAEIKIIGQAQHRNLVRLLGWCHEKGELLLVYDYMPNGSVDQHLFQTSEGEPVLTWARRLKIMSGVATALAYLHEEWEQRVIHRDVKSSNVMLDRDFNPKLGDFGLARLSAHNQAPQSTAVLAGTYGYLAPELAHTLKFSEKTDVYSYGAMVLEVATGRRAILSVEDESAGSNVCLLADWVWGFYSDDILLEAADRSLQSACDLGEMIMFLKIGLLCCHPDPDERPTMREVLNIWKGTSPFPPLPRKKPVPTFISKALVPVGGATATMYTRYTHHSDLPSWDQTSSLESDDQRAPVVVSKDDGDLSSPKTFPGREGGPPIPMLRLRRLSTTTSLPM